jgi:hypothetical protein
MSGTLATKLLLRRGLSSDVPTLDVGELGLDTDTFTVRVGNGTSNPTRIFTEASSGSFNCSLVALSVASLQVTSLATSSRVFTDSSGNLTTADTEAVNVSDLTGTFTSSGSLSLFNGGVNAGPATFWRGDLTWSLVDLSADVTGVLGIPNGGTGATSAADARLRLDAPGLGISNVFRANNNISQALTVGNPTGAFLGVGSVNVSGGFYINGKQIPLAPVTQCVHVPETTLFSGNPFLSAWFCVLHATPVEVHLHCMFKQLSQSPSFNISGLSGFQIFRDGILVASPSASFNVAIGGSAYYPWEIKLLDQTSPGWHYYEVRIVGLTDPRPIGNRFFKLSNHAPLPDVYGPMPNVPP